MREIRLSGSGEGPSWATARPTLQRTFAPPPWPHPPAAAASGPRLAHGACGAPSAAALCSRHGQAAPPAADRSALPRRAGEAVPLAAAAGPGAAPCAGGAWTAGALVRVGGRHCAGRGQAPARAWRELEVGAWCALSDCATRLEAPSGSGAQGGKRRAALSSVAISPRGVVRCGASSARPTPVNAAVRGGNAARDNTRQRAALPPRPAGLPGIAWSWGPSPHTPARLPSLAGRRASGTRR
jgi:hypothetical protein